MAEAHRVRQNSTYPRCTDGRPVVAILDWRVNRWIVTARGWDAGQDFGPQFLGASLMFVHILEVVGKLALPQAFDLTEQVSHQVALACAFHLDDHNVQAKLATMSEAEVIKWAESHHTGCGFAKRSWGAAAEEVIIEARRRHWRTYVVSGGHVEHGAVINYRPGDTLDVMRANRAGEGQFNLDVAEARKVFALLEKDLNQPGFAAKAETWMVSTFKTQVVTLGGVKSTQEVTERR